MKRKYLDEIGCTDRWDKWVYRGERGKKYREQRREWGFDARETFSLQETFYQWLYERLIVFKDIGGQIVDLTYHKFEYNGQEYSQLELIDKLIEELRWALAGDPNVYKKEDCVRLMEIGKIWAIILPAMWW